MQSEADLTNALISSIFVINYYTIKLKEPLDSSGFGQGTSFAELIRMADGPKKFSSGVHGSDDAVSTLFPQDGATSFKFAGTR